jgi:hypothetical protein
MQTCGPTFLLELLDTTGVDVDALERTIEAGETERDGSIFWLATFSADEPV